MKGRRHGKLPPFVALGRKMLHETDWRRLSPPAKIVYIYLKSKFVGDNNGEIELHYSELRDMFAPATISRAFKELEERGWIKREKLGGMYRYAKKHHLTGKHDNALVNYRL